MNYLDNDSLLYLGIILLALLFFLWNKKRSKKDKQNRKDRSFRKRYEERKRKKR